MEDFIASTLSFDSIAAIVGNSITAFVTLIGIAVSYVLSKKNLSVETVKIKKQQTTEKLKDLPARVATLIDDVQMGMSHVEMNQLLADIYAYGSRDAIKILVAFQESNCEHHTANGTLSTKESCRTIALLALLISQLKYDLTGEIIPSEYWLRLKITDYNSEEMAANETINALIKELRLNKRFRV